MTATHPILILDGATGTELASRGIDVSSIVWSARAIREAPQILQQVHEDYLRAGAGAIVTNTFRTHQRSIDKSDLAGDSQALTREAVAIARAARDAANPSALVFGSVAPLEDCYEPEHAPKYEACRAEHSQQIQRLLDGGVDRILIETINVQHEAIAAAHAAQELAAGKWMISFCTLANGPPGMLLSGQPLTDLLAQLNSACAVGVNCMDATTLTPQVRLLRMLLPDDVEIMAYGNIGCFDTSRQWTETDAVSPDNYAAYAQQWRDAGASIIGGCCGTTPQTIRKVAQQLT